MEKFSMLLAICAGNSPVTDEFPLKRPVTRSFDVFFDLRLNKRLSKQSWSWWFETLSCPLWRNFDVTSVIPSTRGLKMSSWSPQTYSYCIEIIFRWEKIDNAYTLFGFLRIIYAVKGCKRFCIYVETSSSECHVHWYSRHAVDCHHSVIYLKCVRNQQRRAISAICIVINDFGKFVSRPLFD